MQNNEIKNNLTIFSALVTKNNILTILFIVGLSAIFLLQIYTLTRLNDVNRKIDHRYFNLTNSLQDIHNVEIETLHGRIYSAPKIK